MNFKLPKIYPITDTAQPAASHAQQVTAFAAGGASLVQIRDKHSSPAEFYAESLAAVAAARGWGVTILINDRVDIALAVGADGVHLGQDDLPPEDARRILGPDALIGFSTHSVEQAAAAADLPIDYIAIGPIFPTATKTEPDPVVGLDGIRNVRAAVKHLPLVAIGGINADNVRSVFAAGADSAAIISYLGGDPERMMEKFRRLSAI